MSEASPAPGSPAPAESGGAFEPIVPRPGTPSNLEALQQNTALHLTDLIHGVVQSAGAGALEERLARIEARIDSVGALDPQVMERLQQAEARTSSVLKTLQDDVARMQSDLSALAELVTVRVAAVGEVAVPSGFKEGARGEADASPAPAPVPEPVPPVQQQPEDISKLIAGHLVPSNSASSSSAAAPGGRQGRNAGPESVRGAAAGSPHRVNLMGHESVARTWTLEQQVAALEQKAASMSTRLSAMHEGNQRQQTELSEKIHAAVETLSGGSGGSGLSLQGLAGSLEAARAELAPRSEVELVATRLKELRADLIAGKGTLGGAGERSEVIDALQAAQQLASTQLLSLQTHVRTLLRRVEKDAAAEEEAAAAGVTLGSLKDEVHAALAELQAQVTALSEGKADLEQTERALQAKADASVVASKADRVFCESMLARFSVEVGKQLGDLEDTQTQLQDSVQQSVTRLLSGASRNASDSSMPHDPTALYSAEPPPPTPPEARPYSLGGGYDAARIRPASPPAFSVQGIHNEGSLAGSPSRRNRRPDSRPHSAARAGMGLLPTSVFAIADSAPAEVDLQARAFQPRRPQGLVTPGEQVLVRQRPSSSHGRLHGSRSTAGLISAPR